MANPKHVAGPIELAGPTWRERVTDAARRGARLVGAGFVAITRPVALIVLMLLTAGACTVAGVWMLVGVPWALLSAAAILFALSALAMRGMRNV